MNKKLLLPLLIITLLFTGCDKIEKLAICKKEDNDINYTVTIEETDKVVVTTDKEGFKCTDDYICEKYLESKSEESVKTFDELLSEYRKDGYSCE